jgi:hypothetical protein
MVGPLGRAALALLFDAAAFGVACATYPKFLRHLTRGLEIKGSRPLGFSLAVTT